MGGSTCDLEVASFEKQSLAEGVLVKAAVD